MKKRSPAAVIAAVLSVLLLALALFLFWRAAHPVVIVPEESLAVSLPEPEPVTPSAEESPAAEPQEEPDDGLPTDQFFITDARKSYADGGMQLIIPKLDVNVPILNGVDKETLRRGVGLYDYAQLPSETRSNTSIAGHRNQIWKGQITMDQPFSYIDLLGEGNFLYLRDSTHIYQYVFEFQEVITPDNWGPIYKTDHSCVTLTTCTPVGVSDHRLIVRAKLSETLPLSETYDYPSHMAEEASAA